MSVKIYKSAMGRVVDLGALMLENENTRAVGNMGVNARGDILDGANRVVETRNKQVQKHYQQQVSTNTAVVVPTVSTRAAKKQQAQQKTSKAKVAKATVPTVAKEKNVNDSVLEAYNDERLVSKFDKMSDTAPMEVTVPEIESADTVNTDVPEIESLEELTELEAAIPELPQDTIKSIPRGGLAAAIAKAQTVKQELLKTPRQLAQNKPGVNKI
jgi:hypothetical protein